MNLKTLMMFLEIVETGSMTQAAERLHISQPALSQQIKMLESQLGCKVLERSNKGVHLTAAGEVVYETAKDMAELCQKMEKKLEALQNNNWALRIVATDLVYSYALPCTIFDVKQKFPKCTMDISALSSDLVENKLLSRQADVGFVVGQPESRGLSGVKVFSDQVFLTVGKETEIPLNVLDVRELYRRPLLMLSHTKKTRRLLNRRLDEFGIDRSRLSILYELDSVESIKQSVINGFGMAFLPYRSMKKELYNEQLKIIDLKGFQMDCDYYMIRSPEFVRAKGGLARVASYLEKTLADTIC